MTIGALETAEVTTFTGPDAGDEKRHPGRLWRLLLSERAAAERKHRRCGDHRQTHRAGHSVLPSIVARSELTLAALSSARLGKSS